MNTEPTVPSPIAFDAAELDAVAYNDQGLVAAIVQDVDTSEVLMMAWMNSATLKQSLEGGRTVFWSRSRQEVWRKGDTSGDHQIIHSAYYDCDGDTLLFKVTQRGNGACHTGAYSCFYRAFGDSAADVAAISENETS